MYIFKSVLCDIVDHSLSLMKKKSKIVTFTDFNIKSKIKKKKKNEIYEYVCING